jgi:hypothetical protein
MILFGGMVANLHDIIAQVKVNNIKDDKENYIKTRYHFSYSQPQSLS